MHRIAILCTVLGLGFVVGLSSDQKDGLVSPETWQKLVGKIPDAPRSTLPNPWVDELMSHQMPAMESFPEMPTLPELPPMIKEPAMEALLESSRQFVLGPFPLPGASANPN